MIIQVINRVNDVRDLCEKRCEQLRHFAKPIYRPVQRVHPFLFPQNDSFNLINTTTSILPKQINENIEINSNQLSVSNNAKMDKKQRLENDF